MIDLSQVKDLNQKTLSLLEELMSQEMLLHKKYLNYANMLYDKELKNICYKTSQKHKENYKKILSYLESLQ